MLKSACVPGTGTNFIPRLFCHGCSLVAFSTTPDGLAIISPAKAREPMRRLPRIAAGRWRDLLLETAILVLRLAPNLAGPAITNSTNNGFIVLSQSKR